MTCALCVPLLCATLFIVDGDTVHCDREKIRLLDFDTPETRRAKCEGSLGLTGNPAVCYRPRGWQVDL